MLQLIDITKQFTIQKKTICVLSHIHLDIDNADFILIEGISGIGKSTLLKIIAGVIPTSKGHIQLSNNIDYELSQFQRQKIGFIFQNFNLIAYHTILENVMLPLKWTNTASKYHVEKARHLLKQMNLIHKQYEYPYTLSGGELQRVSIARALIKDPQLILADEPFSNLDKHNQDQLMQLFCDLNNENKIAFVFAMHENPFYSKFKKHFKIQNKLLIQMDKK